MFTQLELISLDLALHLAINDCKKDLMKIDPRRAEGEIYTFENLIKKIDSLRQK